MMTTTTETEFTISEEPLAERVLRQVRSGTLDESRLLPSAEKLARDVGKKLDRLASRQGWYTFMAGQAYARWPPGKRPRSGTRRSWRWSRSAAGGRRCRESRPTGWRRFDELIVDALNNPAPVQKAEQVRAGVTRAGGWRGRRGLASSRSSGCRGRSASTPLPFLAYLDTRMTNGPVEGINNKLRVIARRAYGLSL